MRTQPMSWAILILSIMFPLKLSAQFETTLQGGPWNHPSTWKDNAIPGATDKAIIKGPVTVDLITQIGSLEIRSGASLVPEVMNSNTIYRLYVKGDIINEGRIEGNNLWIYPGGNVHNSGVWKTGPIYIQDTAVHFFKSFPLSPFNPAGIWADSATIRTAGPLAFDSTTVTVDTLFIGDRGVIMHQDTVYLQRKTILKANAIIGNKHAMVFKGNSYIWEAPKTNNTPVLDNIHLYGTVLVRTSLIFTGETVLYGTLRPLSNSSAYYMIMRGNFINNGEVQTVPSGGLFFEFWGNVTNNGPFAALNSSFKGDTTHVFTMDPNMPFSASKLIAYSDTVISGSSIKLDSTHVQIRRFDLQPGHYLHLTRGSIFSVDTLNANGNIFLMSGNSYLSESVNRKTVPIYRNVTFRGEVRLRYSIKVEGHTRFEGTVQPYSSNSPVIVAVGALENRGQIIPHQPSGERLFFDVDGDLWNYGVWKSYRIQLMGNGPYTLITDSSGTFSPAELSNPKATIHSGSSLYFNNTKVVLKKMVLNSGHSLNLDNQSTFAVETLIGNGNRVTLSGDAYFRNFLNVPFFQFHDVTLEGDIPLYANIAFFGQSELRGTLSPWPGLLPTLRFYDQFQNRGSIQANNQNDRFIMEIYGDFENWGVCDALRIMVQGTKDQTILIDDSTSAMPNVYFKSDRRGRSYQWEKDGSVLTDNAVFSGTTSSSLQISKLTFADAGTYQCRVDSAGTVRYSRKIQVNYGLTSVEPPRQPETDGSGLNPDAPAGEGLPREFALWQNYPNPFNPATTIRFDLPARSRVMLQVYESSGRLIRTLVDGVLQPGRHRIQFSAPELPSGVYFYRLQAEPLGGTAPGKAFTRTQKMILLK